jgi:dihydrofolate reductase
MISMILASTNTGGIGNRGTLPWPKHSQDLSWFKRHTENQIVVMGRNTWEDPAMPKPLSNRINYVVSSKHVDTKYQHLVRWIPNNLVENLKNIQASNPKKNVFVIGGKQLYEAADPVVERIYLTRMKCNWWCDTRINLERMLACYQIKSVTPGENCTYEVWDRILYI